ncbi:hypothetical protein [Tropicimonas sp. S265A]|uniref:hypothetical protein n=1 Tax=Tropicimonas sp. S265A TaxID=3415134 RepID=UPI003C7D7927
MKTFEQTTFLAGLLMAGVLSTPVAADTDRKYVQQTPIAASVQAAQDALAESLSQSAWVKEVLGDDDARGASFRILPGRERTLVSVISEDGERGAVYVGEPGGKARLSPGLYTMVGRETPRTMLDGQEFRLIDIPAWEARTGASAAAIGSVDWMCEGWPDNNGVGLNFCETLVLCHEADLFCGGL